MKLVANQPPARASSAGVPSSTSRPLPASCKRCRPYLLIGMVAIALPAKHAAIYFKAIGQ